MEKFLFSLGKFSTIKFTNLIGHFLWELWGFLRAMLRGNPQRQKEEGFLYSPYENPLGVSSSFLFGLFKYHP